MRSTPGKRLSGFLAPTLLLLVVSYVPSPFDSCVTSIKFWKKLWHEMPGQSPIVCVVQFLELNLVQLVVHDVILQLCGTHLPDLFDVTTDVVLMLMYNKWLTIIGTLNDDEICKCLLSPMIIVFVCILNFCTYFMFDLDYQVEYNLYLCALCTRLFCMLCYIFILLHVDALEFMACCRSIISIGLCIDELDWLVLIDHYILLTVTTCLLYFISLN